MHACTLNNKTNLEVGWFFFWIYFLVFCYLSHYKTEVPIKPFLKKRNLCFSSISSDSFKYPSMSCCCLNLCCLLPLQREWISTKSSPNNVLLSSDFYSFTNNWMKSISDDTFISQLNIPGTHNSMAVRRYFGITIGIC